MERYTSECGKRKTMVLQQCKQPHGTVPFTAPTRAKWRFKVISLTNTIEPFIGTVLSPDEAEAYTTNPNWEVSIT